MAAPAAPTGLAVKQKVGSNDTLIITWDAVDGTAYALYRNGEVIQQMLIGGEYLDKGLTNDTNYTYEIAVQDGDYFGIKSAPVSAYLVYYLATVAELSDFWRLVTDSETTRALTLLRLASYRLRSIAAKHGVDLVARVKADPVYASNVNFVVLESVKRAMQTPQDLPPVDSYQQNAGPYSENYKFTNPAGDLWFKGSELAEIELSGQQVLGSISTTRTNIYGDQEEVA